MFSKNKLFIEKWTQKKTFLTDELNMGSSWRQANRSLWCLCCGLDDQVPHGLTEVDSLEEPLRAWTALRG